MIIENWNREQDTIIRIKPSGEIIEDKVIKNNEDFTIGRRLTESQINYLRYKNELQKFTSYLGGYIHMNYVNNELLFNKLNIDTANISRLIYLSTFIEYSNKEENMLVITKQYNQRVPMTKVDMKKLLKLSDRTFFRFFNDMCENNLIYSANDCLYMNPDYFSKGDCNFNQKEYTRIFIDTTRLLYEGCTPRQHKYLSYIYQLTPYMNYELNILCSNPQETDFYKIDKLSLLQICELLNMSTDKANMRKLRNELLKFNVAMDGVKYSMLSYVKIMNGYGCKDYFVINPTIVWGGSNTNLVQDTLRSCFFN